MCHIPNIRSVMEGAQRLLKDNGVLVFEDPYTGDILQKTSYDQIYDEHVFYFSLASVSYLLKMHGFEVFDVRPLATHGGSMRYYAAREGRHVVSSRVGDLMLAEERLELDRLDTYQQLYRRVTASRTKLVSLLGDLRAAQKRVVGYGATAKSSTMLNFCRINQDLVEFISDSTPDKQGKYTPGTHIPVRSHEAFMADYPDYALLLAWNHKEEIVAKESRFREQGGKWMTYVPEVSVFR